MSEIIEETITESPLFKHLDAEVVQSLIEHSMLHVVHTGESVIDEGATADNLFIVLTGRVRVWTHGPNGPVELKTLGPGSYFGEVSLLSGNTATATVEVKTGPAQIVGIARQRVIELVEEDEKVRKMLQGVTLARAKDTIGKVLK